MKTTYKQCSTSFFFRVFTHVRLPPKSHIYNIDFCHILNPLMSYFKATVPLRSMSSPTYRPCHCCHHTIPLGRPSAPALRLQYHASNLDWWFISYMILYVSMLFSQIIPPSLSPTESKDCSVHLCLFCCLTYRWEGASRWGTRVHPWRIHVDVWQNQDNIVK